MPANKLTFWVASGFLWHGIASFIKIMIKQSNNKARCYHILVFTVLKEQRMASSQKIHKGRCFTFIKGQRDSCLLSELNLPVLYIPWFFSNDHLLLLFFWRNIFYCMIQRNLVPQVKKMVLVYINIYYYHLILDIPTK